MNLKINSNKAFFLAFLGNILFLIFIVIAMFTYPGGIRDNFSIVGYSFWGNSFSDLGRVIAWNGESNLISMILFTIAFGLQVTFVIPFYIKFIDFFSESKLERKMSKIGSYFGIISSIAFIGILFNPADILNGPHWIFVFIGYPSILIMGVCYSIVLISSDEFRKALAYVFTAIFILFFGSLLVGLIGISYSRTIMVIGQKILTFALLIDFFILIYGAWKVQQGRSA